MGVLLAFALAIGVADQAQTTAPARPPVRIDAVASDARGRMVDDLGPADFEIFDDGSPRTVESVRLVRGDGFSPRGETFPPILTRADEQAEAAREGTRLFVFFLDEYHVTPGAGALRARETVGRFVDEHLGPRDLVLVVKPLDSLLTLRLTRDLEAAARAISTMEGRKGELEPRNAFEKNYIAGSPARAQAVREQIVTSALEALATHLGGLGAARKTLVVVGEGFSRSQRRRGDESLPTLEGVIRSANRAGVSIYAIDPRALLPAAEGGGEVGRDPSGQDALRALTDETGGHAILHTADLADGLRRIASDSSTYYVITLRPDREGDGRFHALDVRVKRSGVQLRVRQGYWATDDVWRARLLTSGAPRPAPELPRRISPLIRPWFGQARGEAGKTRVSFVWEPAARVPGDRTRAPLPARITLRASRPDGTPVFEGTVGPTGPFAAPGPGGESPQAVFETPPGRLRVQMSIEDEAARVLDKDIRDVVVGSLDGRVALGTAEVLRARSARAFRELEADGTAAPVAAREFSRAERLLIRVPVYGADPEPVLTARLVSKPGETMRELPVTAANISGARASLDEVIDACAEHWHDELAPAVERVWVDEIASIRRDLHAWLHHLAQDGEEWLPRFFEFGFGTVPGERDASSIREDVKVEGGFRLRGAIDLIEEHLVTKTLRVTDHKTGRKPDRIEKVIIGGGAVLQPVLYAMAVEAALNSPVSHGRLFYCTSAGSYFEHPIPLNDMTRAAGLEVLQVVDRAIENGFLAAAPSEDACGRCDFRPVCGPDVFRRVNRKPQDRLADLLALRSRP